MGHIPSPSSLTLHWWISLLDVHNCVFYHVFPAQSNILSRLVDMLDTCDWLFLLGFFFLLNHTLFKVLFLIDDLDEGHRLKRAGEVIKPSEDGYTVDVFSNNAQTVRCQRQPSHIQSQLNQVDVVFTLFLSNLLNHKCSADVWMFIMPVHTSRETVPQIYFH